VRPSSWEAGRRLFEGSARSRAGGGEEGHFSGVAMLVAAGSPTGGDGKQALPRAVETPAGVGSK
jgi:hypothetical protein